MAEIHPFYLDYRDAMHQRLDLAETMLRERRSSPT
jgi:hypothetical protein